MSQKTKILRNRDAAATRLVNHRWPLGLVSSLPSPNTYSLHQTRLAFALHHLLAQGLKILIVNTNGQRACVEPISKARQGG